MDELDQAVHDELATLAARAPEPGDLAGAVRRRVGRRRALIAMGSVAAVAAVAVVAAAVRGPSLAPIADGHGEVAFGGAGSCAVLYSPDELVKARFAFDGTVTGLGRAVSGGAGGPDYVGVTFRVHQWFTGGSGSSVTVDLLAPVTLDRGSEEAISYGVGTRLLVAGT